MKKKEIGKNTKPKSKVKLIIFIVVVVVIAAIGFGCVSACNDTAKEIDNAVTELNKDIDEINEDVDEDVEKAETPKMTTSQEQAYEAAKSYIETLDFSRKGLIDQLTSKYGSGFSKKDAKFAVNLLEKNGDVNWKQECIDAAVSYLESQGFSKDGLIDQLKSDAGSQFTKKQAENAIRYLEKNDMVNWKSEAVEAAEAYLEMGGFSKSSLKEQLTSEYGDQFTDAQAEYAVNKTYK